MSCVRHPDVVREHQLVVLLRQEAVRRLKRGLSSSLRQRLRQHLQVMGFIAALNIVERHAGTGQVWTLNRLWQVAIGTPDDPENPAAALPAAA